MSEERLDRVHIRDLLIRCVVGINDEERREKQDVIINITLHADLTEPCQSDRIEETVDYKAVKKKVIAMIESSSFFLVEALAEAIAGICLENRLVELVDVSVEKPGALRFAKSVGVEITRRRGG
jgi:FolB domain-containing protein